MVLTEELIKDIETFNSFVEENIIVDAINNMQLSKLLRLRQLINIQIQKKQGLTNAKRFKNIH